MTRWRNAYFSGFRFLLWSAVPLVVMSYVI